MIVGGGKIDFFLEKMNDHERTKPIRINNIEVPCLRPAKYYFRGPTGLKGLDNYGMAKSVAVFFFFSK